MTIRNWQYDTTFDAYNIDSKMVTVTVCFSIDRDDDEVLEFGRNVFKKVYEIDVVQTYAHYLGTHEEYTPCEDDLVSWNHDIREALRKEFNRQTA